MSNLTFGPPVSLDGPLPVAPPKALLNVPGVLVGEDSERWTNGVTVFPYPPGEPNEWDPCSSGTFRTKEEGAEWPLPMFAAFVSYLPITCSAMSIGDPEEFANRAELALNAVESFSAERQLSQGTGIATNPFFDDTNVDILGPGAVSPAVALSYLEDAIGATARKGMIHATPAVASQWFDQISNEGPLITNLGTPVAAGGGYVGGHPATGAAAAAGQAWAYATGPVEVRRAPIRVLQISEVLDRSNNDVTFRAERYLLAEWDTVLQAAVLVDWSP